MSEFKGNKNKWMCYRKTDQHKIEEIRTDKGESICAINFALENSEANAKVLVKALEMLQLLQTIVSSEYTPIVHRKLAKKLIKEATEL